VNVSRKSTKTYRILKFISSHPEGVRFTDIQKFILKMNKRKYTREQRGYYSDRLTGGRMFRDNPGILNRFCLKGSDGLWRFNALITDKYVVEIATGKAISRWRKGGAA